MGVNLRKVPRAILRVAALLAERTGYTQAELLKEWASLVEDRSNEDALDLLDYFIGVSLERDW